MKTIRLVYPQWQGANIAHWIPSLPKEDSSRGYYLGAELMEFLAPQSNDETYYVPVSKEFAGRKEESGVLDRSVILEQMKAALSILQVANPDRVVTFGGECSVSVPVFCFLAAKYVNDVAVIWVDAHPDVTLPGDDYNGFHAMALAACMGFGDNHLTGILPGTIEPKNVALAGVRACEYPYIENRVKDLGLAKFSPGELSQSSQPIIGWLREQKASKVLVHFDMDVMDPQDMLAAVADGPEGGLKLHEVVRLINDIAKEKELVGLTIAEPMPRIAIRLKKMLAELPGL